MLGYRIISFRLSSSECSDSSLAGVVSGCSLSSFYRVSDLSGCSLVSYRIGSVFLDTYPVSLPPVIVDASHENKI